MTYNIDEIVKTAKLKQYEERYADVPNVAPAVKNVEADDLIAVGLPGSRNGIFDVPLNRVMEAAGGMAAMLAAIAKNSDPRLPEGEISDIDPQAVLVRFSFDNIPFKDDEVLSDAIEVIESSKIVKRYKINVSTDEGEGGAIRNLVVEGSVDEVNRFHRRLFMFI